MKNTEQSIQKQFGDVADKYATSAVHAKGADLQTLLHAVELTETEVVLDAGCGAGHTALTVAPHAAEVIAYDLTAAMLKQVDQLAAARELTNITTLRGDVAELPFADASFDRVVSRFSAHHWTQPLVALREFKRVLKPEGFIVLTDVIALDDLTVDTYLQAIELLRDPSHVRDHTVAQWHALFTAAGFTPETVDQFDIPLPFVDWHTRMNTPAQYVTVLRDLFTKAPQTVRDQFKLPAELDADFTFTIYGAVIRGR